jgi:hypothetical protein
MGREVRRVPADWQHPKDCLYGDDRFRPLHDGADYQDAHDGFMEKLREEGLQAALDYYGRAPDENDYMPRWSEAERTHLMMYENTSEGTPISPAFETAEELARWLADNGASAFANSTATYDQWLATIRRGSAISAVSIGGGPLVSGVEAMA